MATRLTAIDGTHHDGTHDDASHEDFSLQRIRRGECDKLGNRILEILWLSPDYAIYRTTPGVFIHFSDDKAKEAEQRTAFTALCPELCELRFLTGQMSARRWSLVDFIARRSSPPHDHDHLLFNHNISQALMLLMENKEDDARAIATAALDMAVSRTTNDNTIRYLRSALGWAALVLAGLCLTYWLRYRFEIEKFPDECPRYLIAGCYGVLGACFSIITRMQSFDMKPCQQSNMNKWMALIRILIGLIGGLALFLLVKSNLANAVLNIGIISDWQGAALLGFLGGFAERMVQSVFERTANSVEGKTGTPVQRARGAAVKAPAPVPGAV